ELIIELPDASLVPLLVAEVAQVDGTDVEDVREVTEPVIDVRLDALETSASLLEQPDVPRLLDALAVRSCRVLSAEWASVVELAGPSPVVAVGDPPPVAWLDAFVAGSRVSVQPAGLETGPEDVAWADLAAAGLVVVLGRKGRPFRTRERRQLAVLSRIVDHRWAELVQRAGRVAHPSALI
ncbi:MAG: hypothetical protein ACRDYC_08000, partial [Acidimicrobiales bacterium]